MKISRINDQSSVPIFQQIFNEIERLVLIGEIKVGELIPSVREFAVTNHINPNTVAKAYALLQERGVVEFVRGTGLRVPEQRAHGIHSRRMEIFKKRIEETVQELESLGFSKNEIAMAVTKTKSRINR